MQTLKDNQSKYQIGERIADSAYFGKIGTIYQVDDYESCLVIHVRWQDGTTSDFMPDENTRILGKEEHQVV